MHLPRSARRMKDHAAAVVSDEAFAKRAERWPVDTPDTKEAYFIREIFEGRGVRAALEASEAHFFLFSSLPF